MQRDDVRSGWVSATALGVVSRATVAALLGMRRAGVAVAGGHCPKDSSPFVEAGPMVAAAGAGGMMP